MCKQEQLGILKTIFDENLRLCEFCVPKGFQSATTAHDEFPFTFVSGSNQCFMKTCEFWMLQSLTTANDDRS